MDAPSDWMLVGVTATRERASLLADKLPRPTPYPLELNQALSREFYTRQDRNHCGEEVE